MTASRSPALYAAAHPRRLPWLESVAAVLILLAAWLYGFLATRSPVEPLIPNVLPGTQRVVANGEVFTAYDGGGNLLGYAAAADATGYGGPIYLLVGVDPAGEIAGIQVIEQRETPGFYTLLREADFVEGFLGRPAAGPFVLGETVDSISGASLSAGAVAAAIFAAGQKVQSGALAVTAPSIRFGLPEITLLALFACGIVLPRLRRPQHKKILRWAMMLTAMVVLGFVLNQPLTLANFASLLVGYWPSWQDHIYWYLLIGGSVAFVVLSGKNTYCFAVCPFGAVQECFGKLGGTKPFLPPALYHKLQWVPRWLAVLALALGLAFRQPGAASYEPFGTLFSLSAGFFPWMLLVFVLFASLIILRPFCHYLCPVKVILEFPLFLRNQARRAWKNKWTVPTT